ncbi:two-component regulator propeller domain-containing protein [Uliginosibacterium sediminicola]|uniref:Two-component regulator propeller domain-containing protein n=1 Tax=Uliginosibacterium sediminicola TaxID=2024550 RepID=A0ABU9YV06_9RHOO
MTSLSLRIRIAFPAALMTRNGFLLAWLIGLCMPSAAALAASLPVALVEFKHEAWSIERGAPSRINSITQTRDGFLWIGGVEGLVNFDGVKFEPVHLSTGASEKLVVSSLKAARSGELWVGLARGRGMAVFRKGRLIDAGMPHPSREVNDIEEDVEGGIWVARGGRSELTLARFHDGVWHEFSTESGLPAQPVWDLHIARDGTLWVVLSNTLVYLRPGETHFTSTRFVTTPRASLAEDAFGQIWISDADGTRTLDRAASPDTFFAHPNPVGGTRLLFDRQGDLWTTTRNNGVLRIREPGHTPARAEVIKRRVASLDATAGLSSDQTRALFEDREGNVWVGTELGLDQLRPASVVVDPDLPPNSPVSYQMSATRDGMVYIADDRALYLIAPGQTPKPVMKLDTPSEALCMAGEHGVWLFLGKQVLRVEAGKVQRYPKPPGTALGCAEDTSGRLWMPALQHGLHWLQGGTWQRWPEPSPSPSLPANAALDRDGRAIVVFRARPPAGELPFRALDSTRARSGGIEGLLPTDAGVLVSGSRGIALADASATSVLSSEINPWAASVNGLAQARNGDTWIIGDAGIVLLRSSDLAKGLLQPEAPIPHRVFGFADGMNSFVQKAAGPQVAVGGDGRVWFLTRRNVLSMAAKAFATNPLPAPVLLRSVTVGGQVYDPASDIELPAGTTTVRLAFTALSLTVPGRVQFRHRLLGVSDEWSAPDNRRNALLTDLHPGTYRFEVVASNNDGLWSEQAAGVTLKIPATLTQSLGFKIVASVAVLLLLYGLYQVRVRQILAAARDRAYARNRERERIARELHDTLLQSVQGLILRFQSIANRVQNDPQTQMAMSQALDRAESVLIEGRDRVQGLRRIDASDLEHEVRKLIAGLPLSPSTQVSLTSQGLSRHLRPEIFDEILCIIGEALFNAAKHAAAENVTVDIHYARQCLTITISDDGFGLTEAIAEQALQSGHFGLLGMRERAKGIDAQLQIEGQHGLGTRISLRIKASVAYTAQHAA